MRVAIVHDWLTGMRGGERVLEALLGLFPGAEIFTLFHVPGSVSPRIEARPIHCSLVARLPRVRELYRYYLPLFPAAVEGFDLRGFDLVLSSSHCVAKGVRPPAGVPHLCYCHSPMRYVWEQYPAYFGPGRARPWVRAAAALLAPRLRCWDVRSAARVHAFVANSHYTASRIRRYYRREAVVVHPPVEIRRFRPAPVREDFYLIVSALVPYKRVDVAVEAFNRLGRRLVVVGDGPELARLRRAAGAHVSFTGRARDEEVAGWLGRCRAFVFPAVEDFGIVAVEAQAAGAPVIAYAAGGALETVIGANGNAHPRDGGGTDGRGTTPSSDRRPTGVFFHEQTAAALMDAVLRFEAMSFDPRAQRANASRFDAMHFRERFLAQVRRMLEGRDTPGTVPAPTVPV